MSAPTLTIVGGDRWTVPQTDAERAVMTMYAERVKETPGMCATCAFRPGTAANRSQLVLHLVDNCLLDEGNTFMCHTHADQPCAGFLALRGAA